MAVVSENEFSKLLARGYDPYVIEIQSRAWVDSVLAIPEKELDVKRLAEFDPTYGTGGIAEALAAALDPGAVVADLKKAAEDMLAGVKPILQPTSWMIVAGLIVVAILLWKR